MPVEIPLTRGYVALVDDADAERVLRHQWHAVPGAGSIVYARSSNRGVLPDRMHRWLLQPPEPLVIDHIDGDGLNNQRSNLRICTRQQNAANRRGKGKYKCVKPTVGGLSFWSSITCNGVTEYLGSFATEEAAARAYDEAAVRLFGDFAQLNFPVAKKNFALPSPTSDPTPSLLTASEA